METTRTRESVYAPKEEHGGKYLSVTQIKRHNEDIGHHWFSAETLRFFNGKVYEDLHLGCYFITSEKYIDLPRRYTIRKAMGDGGIETVGIFQEFATLDQARRAMKKIEA